MAGCHDCIVEPDCVVHAGIIDQQDFLLLHRIPDLDLLVFGRRQQEVIAKRCDGIWICQSPRPPGSVTSAPQFPGGGVVLSPCAPIGQEERLSVRPLDYLDVTRHDHAARAHDPDIAFWQNFKDRTIIYARNEDTIFAVDWLGHTASCA